ncbi:hypothetical protein EHE19_004040 [Ruminiclostridium herbifermentans]|uniref:Polymer-forming cytoskeletal protein n=1 Tax=Ruminiclostridium herbifermentans TaxID=2488810 RepID=A0A4V6ENM9_9FIRM|nr:hypothetical protein [Ruminiclostridium herbifermentans]QNU67654.1 hypothetical protein EHE19_004040 [Ruminiclostridium herbifermentans]
MRKISKAIIITLILLLSVPFIVSAKQSDITTGNLVIFEDRIVDNISSGNVTVVSGNADIRTNVSGSIIVVFGKATINGNVSGDVISLFGELDVLDNTIIKGNLVSIGKLKASDLISVLGTKLSIDFDIISLFKSNGIIINTFILLALFSLAIGLILISIFTKRYRSMAYSMKSGNARRLVLGLLFFISATIVLVFLIFLIIVPITYVLLVIFAEIVVGIYIGRLIFKNNNEKSTIFIEFFVGHIIASIFKIVPLILLPEGSYFALMIYGIALLVIEFVMASFGIGTIIDTGFGKNIKTVQKSK